MKFVDTNIFLYVILRDEVFYAKAKDILERIEKGESAMTSSIVLEEVFAFLEGQKARRQIPTALNAIRSYANLRIVPYDLEDLGAAAKLLMECKYAVDWDDALIATLMKKHQITEIYSNDKDFDKVAGIKRAF